MVHACMVLNEAVCIVSINDTFFQCLTEHCWLLQWLGERLLCSKVKTFRKEACQIISNLAVRSKTSVKVSFMFFTGLSDYINEHSTVFDCLQLSNLVTGITE